MEEIQTEDGRSAGPGEQRVPVGKGDGFMAPCRWRPVPDGEESICDFHVRQIRGARLAVPTNDFFKVLLRYYGIEYLNLNPNGIFHVSVFVHFCEAFVGIKPHWILFRKFF
jgi:hypothetical protein